MVNFIWADCSCSKIFNCPGCRVISVNSSSESPNPDTTLEIFVYKCDVVNHVVEDISKGRTARFIAIIRVIGKTLECTIFPVHYMQPVASGAHPENTTAVFENCPYPVIGQAGFISFNMHVLSYFPGIPVQFI